MEAEWLFRALEGVGSEWVVVTQEWGSLRERGSVKGEEGPPWILLL